MKHTALIIAAAMLAFVACSSSDYKKYADENFKWSLTLESDSAPFKETALTCNDTQIPIRTMEGKDVVLTYNNFCDKAIDVVFRFSPYQNGKGVQITSKVTNNEKGVYVKAITGPIYEDASIDLDGCNILVPWGTGAKFSGRPGKDLEADGSMPKKLGPWTLKKNGEYEMMGKYPSGGQNMQMNIFACPDHGLYLASHDKDFRFKYFITRMDTATGMVSYGIRNMMTCFTGQSVESVNATILPYKGDWHKAADIYSEFLHTYMEPVKRPEWMDHSTAWMLTIMKQQNNELMWPYTTIGKEMTDVAIERGFNMLGLFGWTVGGHDKYYPEYDVDPKMGGEQALKDGIALAHERGMRVIIYVNGQLIDTEGTKFWGETGEDIVVRKADGSDYHQMWQKYKDFPARHHGMACQSDPRWKEIMLNLAKQAHSYGADGIIFDQLGTTNVTYCYSPNHGHSVPAIVYENDKVANLKYVQEEMAKANPDFIVITEGINELENNSVSIFHLSSGSIAKNLFNTQKQRRDYLEGSPAGTYFGQLVKYTIPEWTTTNRVQSPVDNREDLNYSILCGIRPEIECRYAPDVQYLENGRMPLDDDYSNMVSKVDISMVKAQNYEEMRDYTKQVNDFLLANADLFFTGRFVDTVGYEIATDSKAVRSSSFVNGNKRGIVVWNPSREEAASYSLKVPGYKLVKVIAPEGDVAEAGTLAPSALQFAIYEK